MSEFIATADLHDGDVLLYHGKNFISKLVRLFDGGDYSHAGIFAGGRVLEAVGSGVEYQELAKSVAGATYVDVYRYKSEDNAVLGSPQLPGDPVLENIHHYEEHRERYGYEQLLLLAILAATRRPPFGLAPGLAMIMRNLLESAADIITSITDGGREPMICSELVFRCYDEAGEDYKILVVGADILSRFAGGPLTSRGLGDGLLPGEDTEEAVSFQAEARTFLAEYESAKGSQIAALDTRSMFELSRANPNYVTPRDLQKSPSLRKMGTLRL
ncbi:MAG: hypothetical protein K9K66_01630 [Desulfarculaceae bacterium]|nr:hypothetical protein [Desulfarculaceae bacterium]MCF8072415.1 hypothetical protein [Desulfarculaceae bacterium]MCF8100336.1 hypothetical protein [Desulfarculaceae bacterium]MCF8117549.1 hypothetical protein [Desulfarculaceae bacterium]